MFQDIWNYRYFIFSSIYNDLVNRFIRSKIGGLWVILNPLSQVTIYTLILSNVLRAKFDGIDHQYGYIIYLLAGLLAWTLFNEITTKCLTLFIENGNFLKKIHFPRITLPIITAMTSYMNSLFLFLATLVIVLIIGHKIEVAIFLLLPLSLLLLLFSMSLGIIIGVLNVFARDIGHAFPVMMQVWFWLTPIIYPVSIIPEQYQHYLKYNPIYPIIDAFQQVLLYGKAPSGNSILILFCLTSLLFFLAFFIFRKANAEMVDVV